MKPAFVAVDWGTTNRRVFAISPRAAVTVERDALGAAAVTDYPGEVAAIRARWNGAPMLLAGMVGSNIGWHQVPYVRAPADVRTLAARLFEAAAGVRIVPGVSSVDGARGDVMRGEEVQLLGAVEAGLAPGDALLCQPGTHCKWATMEAARLVRFTTSMTGELFALLRRHSLLSAQLAGEAKDDAAFLDGVAEGARGDLAASLFGIRAAGLLTLRADADAASYASGLLIGADVAKRLEEHGRGAVHILADAALGALYRTAVEALGGTATLIDSEAAFVAGITRIWELADEPS